MSFYVLYFDLDTIAAKKNQCISNYKIVKDELVYNPNYNKQNHPFLEDYYFWKSLDKQLFTQNLIKVPKEFKPKNGRSFFIPSKP